MTKEYYVERLKDLEAQLSQVKANINELRNEYINTNVVFKVGQKVLITSNNGHQRNAFIAGYNVAYRNDVEYLAYKAKKDGSPSKHNDCIWSLEQVEAAD